MIRQKIIAVANREQTVAFSGPGGGAALEIVSLPADLTQVEKPERGAAVGVSAGRGARGRDNVFRGPTRKPTSSMTRRRRLNLRRCGGATSAYNRHGSPAAWCERTVME